MEERKENGVKNLNGRETIPKSLSESEYYGRRGAYGLA